MSNSWSQLGIRGREDRVDGCYGLVSCFPAAGSSPSCRASLFLESCSRPSWHVSFPRSPQSICCLLGATGDTPAPSILCARQGNWQFCFLQSFSCLCLFLYSCSVPEVLIVGPGAGPVLLRSGDALGAPTAENHGVSWAFPGCPQAVRPAHHRARGARLVECGGV